MKTKRVISMLLSLMLIAMISIPGLEVSAAASCNCGKDPIIYVIGRATIYSDPSLPADQRTEAIHATDAEISAAVTSVMPYLLGAVTTNNWTKYCDKLCEAVEPFFADFVLDNNGDISNYSGIDYSWSKADMTKTHSDNSLVHYVYKYDSRLDPVEIAADFNKFVETVKAVTGHSKVAIVSRCLGTTITMTYLNKYASKTKYSGISSVVFYNGVLNGFSLTSELFTGNISINSTALSRYSGELFGSAYFDDFIKKTLSLFNSSYGASLGSILFKDIYNKIYTNVVPRLLKETYATAPGYWSMVDDAHYAQAKEFVFGNNTAEYSSLIKKLDNYHNTVQLKNRSVVSAMRKAGVSVSLIAKYGSQLMPVVENCEIMSDDTVDVYSQTFGATCSTVSGSLSNAYIDAAEKNGTSKYISIDKQIDASTGILPKSTWYFKNIAHADFPSPINKLLLYLARSTSQPTVTSNSDYPQFMVYDKDSNTIAPLTEENSNTNEDWNYNLLQKIFTYLVSFVRVILNLFNFGSTT